MPTTDGQRAPATLPQLVWRYVTERLREKGLVGVLVALAASFLVTAFLYGFFAGGEGGEGAAGRRGDREQLQELRRRRQQRQQQQRQQRGASGGREGQPGGRGEDAAAAPSSLLARKFFGARVITITANDVLFSRSAQDEPVVRARAFLAVSALSRSMRGGLFIISKVSTDEEEEAVRALLAGGIAAGGDGAPGGPGAAGGAGAGAGAGGRAVLHGEAHKLLFCSTDIGKTAIVR